VEGRGGLQAVLEGGLWAEVAAALRLPRTAHSRLDALYCTYLLPYAVLSKEEKEKLLKEADEAYARISGEDRSREEGGKGRGRPGGEEEAGSKLATTEHTKPDQKSKKGDKKEESDKKTKEEKGSNSSSKEVGEGKGVENGNNESKTSNTGKKPKQLAKEQGDEDSSDEESEESSDDEAVTECYTKGKSVSLAAFYRQARNTAGQWLPDPEGLDVEARYWTLLTRADRHVCVHEGHVDTSVGGFGFPSGDKHPWSLKSVASSERNLLRGMVKRVGVTSPTLHLGMLFSSVCWYRDPHQLPWLEYLHAGPPKIWYSVAPRHERQLRTAVEALAPGISSGGALWLPADSCMLEPLQLIEKGVPVRRLVQRAGQFVAVWPGAFTASVCSGYSVSESLYVAPHRWLQQAPQVCRQLKEARETGVFCLARLLLGVTCDPLSPPAILSKAIPLLSKELESVQAALATLSGRGVAPPTLQPLKEAAAPLCAQCRQEQVLAVVRHGSTVLCLPDAVQHATVLQEPKACSVLLLRPVEEVKALLRSARARLPRAQQSDGAV